MSDSTSKAARIKVLCAGIFSLILVMGVARFAYTPLLPVMINQAGLTTTGAGWLAAINYAGYLSGVLIASLISDAILKDRLYRLGIVIAVISTALMGISTDFYVWGFSRFIAGLGTAAGLMLGSGLILNWLIRHQHRSELGIHFSGVGLGIALCSIANLWMNHYWQWDIQWYVFTIIGAFLLVPALAWFPHPTPKINIAHHVHPAMQDSPPSPHFMRLFIAAYCCAGVGYVVTATYMVAIVNEIAGLEKKGGWMFLIAGIFAAPSCIVWDLVARRTGEVTALMGASGLLVLGILMPTLGWGLTGALIGAILYGATTIGIVSLVLTMAGRFYPTQPAKMMGKMTIAYGISQIVAPPIVAWLTHFYGNYQMGLYLAAAVMALATYLFYLMKQYQ
jgi:MFS family permease